MNKYDERYDIRLARYNEIEEIMHFIDEYWKKGHILARDRDFFEYEMVIDGQVDFIIAKDRVNDIISGLHGFIPASKNREKLDIWGSIWKVIDGSMGFLGIEIVKRAGVLTGARNFLSIGGNSETTVPINRKILRLDDVGKMQHFYCVSDRDEYHIAIIDHYDPFKGNTKDNVDIIKIDSIEKLSKEFDFEEIASSVPYKDMWYIEHRYFDHPIYKYDVYGLKRNDERIEALLVCREQEYNDAKALRIVDYIGKQELFAGISGFLKEKLGYYEYIDFYCYGFDSEHIKKAGMIELTENDTNIIPNYFAPYVAKNIDIWVGTPKGKALFFKADGDQDRPC